MRKKIPTTIAQAILLLILPLIVISPTLLLFRNYIGNELLTNSFAILYTLAILVFVWIRNGNFNFTKVDGILCEEKAKKSRNILLFLAFISIIIIRFGLNIKGLSSKTSFNNVQYHYPSYLFLFSAVILGPILEEIIFRKIILTGLLSKYSPFKAIIYTSLLFGCMHYHPLVDIIQAFLIGIILCIVFYASGKLWITILCHSFANILGFAFTYIRSIPSFHFLQNFDYQVITLILCSIFIVYLIKRIYNIIAPSI